MPRALILAPQRRSMVSSRAITTGPVGTKAATSSASNTPETASADQQARLSTAWKRAKSGICSRPAARSAAVTVRRCGARMAPVTSTTTRRHVGRVNSAEKGRSQSDTRPAGSDRAAIARLQSWTDLRHPTLSTPSATHSMAPKNVQSQAQRVFLAHAREDKDRVRALYKHIKQRGFSLWLDEEDLIPGQTWKIEIEK